MPTPAIWRPTVPFIESTNLYTLMRERKASSYAEIHAWSVQEPEAFIERTLKALSIKFTLPYERIMDLSEGPAHVKWLPGAKINIAANCFKNRPARMSLITRRSNGETQIFDERQLDTLSNRVANGLVSLGLRQGDAIAIDMPMTAEAVAAYLGVIKAGMAVISIPDSLPTEQIAARLKIGGAKAVFTQSEIVREGKRLPMYEKIKAAENAPQIIVIPPHGEKTYPDLRSQDKSWAQFLSNETTFTPVACNPCDTTNIIFSSGTTGTPKAIPWDHITPIKAASDAHYHQDIRSGDIVCWPTNLGWMMGPWLVYASLINGAAIALYEGAPGERGFCQFIQDVKVTMLGLVPSIVAGWRNTGNADGLDWSSLRCFSSSGEASNPEAYGWLMGLNQKKGEIKPVVEYCGGTEVGGSYISDVLVEPVEASQFNARVIGIDFAILNSDGEVCGVGETGEVFLKPPALGLSTRLHNADNFEVYFKGAPEGLRRHGDLMTVIDVSHWKSNGRAGNDMNLGGIKVGSTEIEQTVNKVSGVLETAAIGVPSPGGGPDRLVIYAVLKDGVSKSSIKLDELKIQMQAAIKTGLNPLFHLHDVLLTDALPRTASNKVMHKELRTQYAARGA